MITKLFFLGAILLSVTVKGQNLAKLDNNNGFRKFKFGMFISQVSNLEISTTYDNKLRGVTTYKYTGNDITDIEGVKINEIILAFYRNRLYQIFVSFGTIYTKYSDADYDKVDYLLKATFGNDTHNCKKSSSSDLINCQIWDAQKVRLEHIRSYYSEADGTRKSEFKYISGYILFDYKPTEKEQQNSELEN